MKYGAVSAILAAGTNSLDLIEVQAGLRISRIQFLRCKESMALTPHICHLEHQVLRQLTLDGQVVLLSVLRAHMRCCLSVEKNWAEEGPIHWLISRGIEDSVKRIRRRTPILILERQIEHGIVNTRTSSERWLRAELFHNQLFNRVVENSKTRADTGFAGPAK